MRNLIPLLGASLLLNIVAVHAAGLSPIGRWTVFDDDTGKPEAIIEIRDRHGALYGWVDEILDQPRNAKPPRCTECEGDLKDAPIVGLHIVQDMRREDDVWRGHIMDPESGKTYNATLSLAEEGLKLEVRGYIGIPLFGRSQTWERAE